MRRFLIVNGPNLQHIGQRQPHIYGHENMDIIPQQVEEILPDIAHDIELLFFQSNHEGAIIDRIEQANAENIDGIVLNAGALTHTSLALADCIAWISVPCVEVHISNVFARDEEIRQKSFIGKHVIGMISGFGIFGYALAVQALMKHISKN